MNSVRHWALPASAASPRSSTRVRFRCPAQVSPETATAANESIAAAIAGARQLPPDVGNDLLTAARETFNTAFTNVAGLCAVVFLVLAVLAFVTLRDVPLIGTQPDQDDMTTREPKGLVA